MMLSFLIIMKKITKISTILVIIALLAGIFVFCKNLRRPKGLLISSASKTLDPAAPFAALALEKHLADYFRSPNKANRQQLHTWIIILQQSFSIANDENRYLLAARYLPSLCAISRMLGDKTARELMRQLTKSLSLRVLKCKKWDAPHLEYAAALISEPSPLLPGKGRQLILNKLEKAVPSLAITATQDDLLPLASRAMCLLAAAAPASLNCVFLDQAETLAVTIKEGIDFLLAPEATTNQLSDLGLLIRALDRLHFFTEEESYHRLSARIISQTKFYKLAATHPLLDPVIAEHQRPPTTLTLLPESIETDSFVRACLLAYRPHSITILLPPVPSDACFLPPTTKSILAAAPVKNSLLFICCGDVCAPPTNDRDKALRLIREFGLPKSASRPRIRQ